MPTYQLRNSLAPITLALAALAFAGCGGSRYDFVDVTGVVTLDGKPLEGATVKFQPQGGGAMSYGVTDGSGRYELETMKGERGTIVATHTVSVSKTSGTADASSDEAQPTPKQLIPPRYNTKSELAYEVKAGSNQPADFALTSK